jgi:hypothetical protein
MATSPVSPCRERESRNSIVAIDGVRFPPGAAPRPALGRTPVDTGASCSTTHSHLVPRPTMVELYLHSLYVFMA